MRVSLNWLKEYIDLSDLSPAQVAAALTDIGHEVEGTTADTRVSPDVVVGKVLSAIKHPNADTLRVTSVDVGEAEPLPIVCGAPNAREGIFVAVAKPGAVLPGDFKIKKTKIRGEVSNGMLCSEKELGISDDGEGIIELKPDLVGFQLGRSIGELLGLSDTLYEVNVTPNRGDCLGLIGLARDLAARLKRPLREPLPELPRDASLQSSGKVTVSIADAELCPRFVALYVRDVPVIPSPAWMRDRLVAAGMRSINLIVDATNYAMLEYSQPIHAYDERQVRGGKIAVRPAKAGETLKTLDGQTRKLEEGDILICDGTGPIGLAGIMGGEDSEVKEDTKNIIIEVASFEPRRIRRTARRLGLHTEASHRFERGTDIDVLPRVAARVADLIARGAKEAGAALKPIAAATAVDQYPGDVAKRVIALRLSAAKQLLGLNALTKDDVVQILERLEFPLLDSNDDRMVFEVPFWRNDCEREADLIEEVARIYGFDKIPYALPVMNIKPVIEDRFIEFGETTRTVLAAQGLRETISFPFLEDEDKVRLRLPDGHPLTPSLHLKNPIAANAGNMQTTLLPGLIKAIAGNRRHGARGVRLFECGRAYLAPAAAASATGHPYLADYYKYGRHVSNRAKGDVNRPVERHLVAGILDQPYTPKTWGTPEVAADFFHGKMMVAATLKALGIDNPDFRVVDGAALPFLHPGASAAVYAGRRFAGYVGELHPATAAAYDLGVEASPVVFELDLESLFDGKARERKLTTELMKFPPASRDVAFLAGQEVTHAGFADAIGKFKRKRHLTTYSLFDVYQGDKLPAGKKSMAYTFNFQSAERTLTDQEVEGEITALVQWLGESLQVTQR